MPKLQEVTSEFIPAQIPTNLREADLVVIYKLIPPALRSLADSESLSAEEINFFLEAVQTPLHELRRARVEYLQKECKRGIFIDVRSANPKDLGRTRLALALGEPVNGRLDVHYFDGNKSVPLWWVRRAYRQAQLPFIYSWKSQREPELSDGHPIITDSKWRSRFEDGLLEPLEMDAKVATSKTYIDWQSEESDAIKLLAGLSEDQLQALNFRLMNRYTHLEREHASRFEFKPGQWIEVQRDSVRSYAVFLGKDKGDKIRVWSPPDDAGALPSGELLPTETRRYLNDYMPALYRVPIEWAKSVAVEKGLVALGADGLPSDGAKLQHSPTFKRLSTLDKHSDITHTFLTVALQHTGVTQSFDDWGGWWTRNGSLQSTVIKKRGQALNAWFQTWKDPLLPTSESYNSLLYAKEPLKVYLKTHIVTLDGDEPTELASYLRAEFDLLNDYVRTKDALITFRF